MASISSLVHGAMVARTEKERHGSLEGEVAPACPHVGPLRVGGASCGWPPTMPGQLLAINSAAAAGGAAAQLCREELVLEGLCLPHVVACLSSRTVASGVHHFLLEFAAVGSLADDAARSGAGSRSPPSGHTRGTRRGGWHTFTGGHWCTATSRQGMWLSAGTATPDTWTWVRVARAASSSAFLMASSRSCMVGGGAGGERVVGEDRVGGGAHDGEAERCERIGVERGSVGERVGRRRRM